MTMFVVLSSRLSHFESSPGSSDVCRPAPVPGGPQTRPTDLVCKSACRLLYGLHTSSPFYYYSARKLILILPSHGGWKAKST